MASAAVTPDNQSIDVNTTAPDPIASLGSQDTSLIQPPMQQQMPASTVVNPGSSDGLDAQQQAHHGMLYKLLDEVGTALGGKNSFTVERGDDGKMQITPHESSLGDKWKRVGVAAIRGMMAGAANGGTGPGNLTRAAGAGAQAGYQGANNDRQQQIDTANDDFKKKQETTLFNANMALSAQRLHEAVFQNMRDGVQFDQGQADRRNGISQMLQDHPGTEDLGVSEHVEDLADLAKNNPDVMKHHVNGRIYSEPEYKDGQYVGMHNYIMDQDFAKRLNAQPATYRDWKVDDKGQGSVVYKTISANAMPNEKVALTTQQGENNVATGFAGQHKQKLEDDKAASEAEERRSVGAKNYADARKTNQETTNLQSVAAGAGDANSPFETNAAKLADGTLLLSELPKRINKGDPTPQQYIARAEQLSQQKYGRSYDPAAIAREQKFAESIKTTSMLDGIDSLVGAHGQTGLIDQLSDLARKAGVTNTSAPLNEVRLAVQKKLGNTAAKNFDTMRSEVQRRVGGLIGNPLLGGGETDKKLQQAHDAYGGDVTLDNLVGGGKVIKDALSLSRDNMRTNNRFIRQRYGEAGANPTPVALNQPGAPQQQQQPPAGATAEVHDQTGKLIGYAVNGQYQPLQQQQ